MKHEFFEIKNFKGIDHIKFDFNAHPRSQVYTMVGLNESGKTTILEALNFFSLGSEGLQSIQQNEYVISDPHDVIPKNKKGNFNERISIKIGFHLNKDDNFKIDKFLKDKFSLALAKPIEAIEVEEYYSFADSLLISKSPERAWSFAPIVHKYTTINRNRKNPPKNFALTKSGFAEQWTELVGFIKTLLPSVLYFPNFLFDFPDRIYLEDVPTNLELHRAYRNIIQDVLHSMPGGFDLQKHVLDRMKSDNSNDKEALRSVLTKMGNHISSRVFSSWNNIFQKPISHKQINIENGKDEVGGYFLELRLRQGDDDYRISERSLGFRWFFAFLLLTQYRPHRKGASGDVLFLFDEPASNLHSTAQGQLRDSFDKIGDCSVVYTTHSHHLINPAWLEGTYVVRNEGLDYEQEDDYLARNTKVTLHKYRDFVAQNPNQENYFKPILDVLDYRPSELENVPDMVMIEGKSDFYALRYLQDKVLPAKSKVNLLPGSGAGSLENVIRLYVGWGRNFVVLLDADGAGKKEKSRYEEIFGPLVEGKVFTLEDVNPEWSKKGIEKLFDPSDSLKIQAATYPAETAFNKTHFNRSIQELYLTNTKIELSKNSKENIQTLLDFCKDKLKENHN